MYRKKMKRNLDQKVFKRTVVRKKALNTNLTAVPRGGTRL